MSHNRFRDKNKMDISKNVSVVSKWLAIVLVPDSRKKVRENSEIFIESTNANINQSSDIRKDLSYNGKELLTNFKTINKMCYWNPCLVESIKSLEYKGFVEPCTVLVTGRDTHLENLRSAWGRRVLKAPEGFIIERIGDVSGIQMQVIPQTQVMPLSDALCSIIMELNVDKVAATLEVVLETLLRWYSDCPMPSQQNTIDTLGDLIRQRKVFHTGTGYYVVTPDTSTLHNSVNSSYLATTAPWLPYHSMYVPAFHDETPMLPSRTHMRSISCQVTTIEESSEEEDNIEKKKDIGVVGIVGPAPAAKPENVFHFPGKDDGKSSKNGKVISTSDTGDWEFKRPYSATAKAETGKAVNLKPGNGNTGKEKGEKPSLFSKLFNRKKKDKNKLVMPPLPPIPASLSVVTITVSSHAIAEEKGEKEYATFSAQFPPPEWVWYQQQQEKQNRVETWVTQISSTLAAPAPQIITHPPRRNQSQTTNDSLLHLHGASASNLNQMHGDYMPMSAFSSLDGRRADFKIPKQIYGNYVVKPLPVRPGMIHNDISNASSLKQHCLHLDGNSRRLQRLSEYSVVDPSDVTSLNNSNIYQSVLTLSPVANIQDRSTYSKISQQPPLGPCHSTPLCGGPLDRTTYKVDGQEARDRIYGPADAYLKRKSHRYRERQHRVLSYYSSQGSDISYEYKGCLPKKNSSQTKSRDSGVNCVGLAVNSDKVKNEIESTYENATHNHPCRPQSIRRRKKHSTRTHPPNNHVLIESNCEAEDESINVNLLSSLDCTTSSVACPSNSTNLGYNSVVYGSTTDVNGASSVMYQTTLDSYLESSEMLLPYNSLYSDFYEESKAGLTCSSAASGQVVSRSRGFVEPLSSPETVIVDVVGSQSEVEDVHDLCHGMFNPLSNKGAREAQAPIEDNAQSVQWRCDHLKVDFAEVCNGSSDEASAEDCMDYDRKLVKGANYGVTDSSAQFKICKSEKGECPVDPAIQRNQDVNGGKNNYVPDSGFSSPMNAEATDEVASTSTQSNSASDNSSDSNNQGNNKYQHNHKVCKDITNRPVLSSDSNGNICLSTARKHQIKSRNSDDNLCNEEYLHQRGCQELAFQKSTSSNQQSSSLHSISSSVHSQQPLHNSAQCNYPATKHTHHHVSSSRCDHRLPARMPLQANPEYIVRRPHRAEKSSDERSHSSNFSNSKFPSDLKNLQGRQQLNKYGLCEEFHLMGVL